MGQATQESALPAPLPKGFTNGPAERAKVLELLRVSTTAQAGEDRAGIPAQHATCAQLERAHKLEIVEQIKMINISGAAVMYAPEMQRLQELVRSGRCQGIVMKEFSRLQRTDNFEDMALFQVFKEHGVKLYTEAGAFDLTKPGDQLMVQVHAGISGYERSVIKARMMGGKEALRVAGKCATSARCLPLGVCYDKKLGWYYDPATIGRVQRLFKLFTEGETNFRMLAKLTGITYCSIRNILRNQLYIGWRVYEYERDGSTRKVREDGSLGDAKKVRRAVPLRIQVMEKGAIPDAQFAKAQLMFDAKRTGGSYHKNRRGRDPFLFRGFLRCGICGAHMTTMTKTKRPGSKERREYYVCQHAKGISQWDLANNRPVVMVKPTSCPARRLERVKLEAEIEKFIVKTLPQPGFLNSLLEDQKKAAARGGQRNLVARLKRDLEVCQQRTRKLRDLYLEQGDADMTKAEYDERRLALEVQQVQIRHELAKAQPVAPKLSQADQLKMVEWIEEWEILKPAEKRRVLVQTIPVFNVSAIVPEGQSRMVPAQEYKVTGFYLQLPGLEAAQALPKKGQRPVNTGEKRLADKVIHPPMDEIIGHPIYLQLP